MKKAIKWIGILLGSIILIVALTVAYFNYNTNKRLSKTYDITPRTIDIPNDSASIAEGKRWAMGMCSGCHGEDLAGTKFIDIPDLGIINAPNLTSGKGGVGATNTDADWLRAIRHAVKSDGTPAFIMPAMDFQYMSDEHMGQLIAYIKSVDPVDKEWAAPDRTLLCNILIQMGAFGDVINVETLDHNNPGHKAPEKGVTAEYGSYLVKIGGCRTCHGEELNGGKDPNPEAPMGPNLTPGGSLASWGTDGFINTFKTGVTPMGKELNLEFMRWDQFGHLDSTQLSAMYTYFMSLPAMETAVIE
jgi:mono/diheme cytochrome c family protein